MDLTINKQISEESVAITSQEVCVLTQKYSFEEGSRRIYLTLEQAKSLRDWLKRSPYGVRPRYDAGSLFGY